MPDDVICENIEGVARRVQRAFLDIHRDLEKNSLTKEQRTAIASLPLDNITGNPKNRFKKSSPMIAVWIPPMYWQ
jgi:hypothetical protein